MVNHLDNCYHYSMIISIYTTKNHILALVNNFSLDISVISLILSDVLSVDIYISGALWNMQKNKEISAVVHCDTFGICMARYTIQTESNMIPVRAITRINVFSEFNRVFSIFVSDIDRCTTRLYIKCFVIANDENESCNFNWRCDMVVTNNENKH